MTEQNAIVISNERFLAPVADVTTALRRYQAMKDFISTVLKEGTDYGKIPGADKPSLQKPGAEKLSTFFGLHPHFDLTKEVEDWIGADHDGEPFFYYRYKCQLWRSDVMVAEGEGSANSWEVKYRYRQAERVCPNCGKPAIIAGKPEYGGGWLCFGKKGGCGSKYPIDDERITGQHLGRVKNPDPADIVNTLQKMAQKRALIAPVLIATNASEYFTQDIEDFMPSGPVIEGHFQEANPAGSPMAPSSGHELAPEQPIKPKTGNGKGGKSIAAPIVQAIVEARLAENPHEAVGMLQKSNLEPGCTPEQAVEWSRLYRGWRDATGATSDQAAERANEGKQP